MTCKAHTSSGKPCKAPAIKGGVVCKVHGGAAPQVREAARLRLAMMIEPALGALAKSLKSKSERIRLDAARDVLDRNSLKGKDEIALSGSLALTDARAKLADKLAAIAAAQSDQTGN